MESADGTRVCEIKPTKLPAHELTKRKDT